MSDAPATTVEQPATQTPPRKPLRLVRNRSDAIELLKNQLKIGGAIRDQRISNMWELSHARAEKQEWVARYTELLNELFNDPSAAEFCNDWVGPVFPEYAEFGLFAEQFGLEMEHRLSRLAGVLKKLPEIPERTIGSESQMKQTLEQTQVLEPVPTRPTQAPAATPAAAAGAAAPASATTPAASDPGAGLVIVRSADENAVQAIVSFVATLGPQLVTINQRDDDDDTRRPLIDLLCEREHAAFALIVDEASNGDGDYLFDLGCCVGKFGRSRLCVLHTGNASADPTTRGVRIIGIDPVGGWQLALARHLKSGGVKIDLNKLL